MSILKIELPPKLLPMFAIPRGELRYRAFRGGRGSGKSFTAAKMAAIWGAIEPLRILCTREFQNSIKESFHAELKNAIESNEWLATQYDVGIDYLRHKTNGTEFIFKGLRHNITAVKSMAQVDLCIVEEAETIPQASWQDLIPTIRAPKSEFWIIWNPKARDSWVAKQFDGETNPPRSMVVTMNYCDNPWFTKELDEQRRHDQATLDPALYAHIWEGAYYEQSEAQVFSGKYRVAEFTPSDDWDGPYFGLDFGFANDPSAGIKSWIAGDTLYIEHEFYEQHVETDHMTQRLTDTLPDVAKYAMRADNARPETISYLKRHGLPRVEACKKGKGSVEDGVELIKSFREVIIHPRCRNTLNEFNLYSYKVDRYTGDILPQLVDANNHAIDALRYALEPIMKKSGYSWGGF